MSQGIKEFWVEDFINKVAIERKKEDDCELEVSEQAMILYQSYPCYKEWIIFPYSASISDYMRNREGLNERYKRRNYRGAYLLKKENEEMVLTADILTSIKSPINIWLRKKKIGFKYNCKGEEIREKVLNDELGRMLGNSKIDDGIIPFMKAFAYVYYWCGNMMPVICNPLGTGCYGDNWMRKVGLICDAFSKNELKGVLEDELKNNGRYTKLWPLWIRDYSKHNKELVQEEIMQKFMDQNYLWDMYEAEKLSASDINESWFLINAKMIIQRSYRIEYGIQKKFNIEQENCVKEIFETVFKRVGLPEEKWNLDLI